MSIGKQSSTVVLAASLLISLVYQRHQQPGTREKDPFGANLAADTPRSQSPGERWLEFTVAPHLLTALKH